MTNDRNERSALVVKLWTQLSRNQNKRSWW